jgi:hypothetical protein
MSYDRSQKINADFPKLLDQLNAMLSLSCTPAIPLTSIVRSIRMESLGV